MTTYRPVGSDASPLPCGEDENISGDHEENERTSIRNSTLWLILLYLDVLDVHVLVWPSRIRYVENNGPECDVRVRRDGKKRSNEGQETRPKDQGEGKKDN